LPKRRGQPVSGGSSTRFFGRAYPLFKVVEQESADETQPLHECEKEGPPFWRA